MEIYERIFEIQKSVGKTQKDLASYVGVSLKTVENWRTRGSDPSAKYLPSIADFLEVSLDMLLTGKEKSPSLAEDEQEVIELWRELQQEGRDIIKGELRKEIRAQRTADADKSTRQEVV